MARFRIGNVRFGGGRKASVGFHVGPFGVTFGGKRRNSKSSSITNRNSEVEITYLDWDSLSENQKRTVPLKSIQVDYQSLSKQDKALLDYRRKKESYRIRWAIGGCVLFVATVFSTAAPFILGCLGVFSIGTSTYFIYKSVIAKRIRPGVEPTDRQLKAWAFVNDKKTLPSFDPALLEVEKKYEGQSALDIKKITGNKVPAKRKITFRELVFVNLCFNVILLVIMFLALGLATTAYEENCKVFSNFNSSTVSIIGVNDCFDLSEQKNGLQEFAFLIGFSTILAFVISLFLSTAILKSLTLSLVNILAKKIPLNKATPKNAYLKAKEQRAKGRKMAEEGKKLKAARTQELRERFNKKPKE